MADAVIPGGWRPGLVRTGVVIALVLSIAAAVPAVMVGFDGSGWDGVVIAVAVLSAGTALATLVLAWWAWRGVRPAALAIAVLQLVGVLPALPAFFLPADEVGGAILFASAGILANVLAAALILFGLRGRS